MKKLQDIKIVFFGTPEFAVASLDALVAKGADIAAVVTMPDKPAGRGHKMYQSDVKKYAEAHGLPLLQPANLKDPQFIDVLQAIGADLFIVIAFRMLPQAVWQMPPLGTFNLHASLLPKYRGAAPINWAVMNGETETGVTTFMLKHEIDTGDILSQRKIEILPTDNVGDVHDRLMAIGAEEVVKTVEMIAAGTAKPMPQPEGEFTPAPKIFKEDCHIDWSQNTETIHNQVRGLSPYPAAYTFIHDANGKQVCAKIFVSAVRPFTVDGVQGMTSGGKIDSGKVNVLKNSMYVMTGDTDCHGCCIEILELQPAGKKRMTAEAFLAGYNPDFCE